jgi:hypothetical protein
MMNKMSRTKSEQNDDKHGFSIGCNLTSTPFESHKFQPAPTTAVLRGRLESQRVAATWNRGMALQAIETAATITKTASAWVGPGRPRQNHFHQNGAPQAHPRSWGARALKEMLGRPKNKLF